MTIAGVHVELKNGEHKKEPFISRNRMEQEIMASLVFLPPPDPPPLCLPPSDLPPLYLPLSDLPLFASPREKLDITEPPDGLVGSVSTTVKPLSAVNYLLVSDLEPEHVQDVRLLDLVAFVVDLVLSGDFSVASLRSFPAICRVCLQLNQTGCVMCNQSPPHRGAGRDGQRRASRSQRDMSSSSTPWEDCVKSFPNVDRLISSFMERLFSSFLESMISMAFVCVKNVSDHSSRSIKISLLLHGDLVKFL